MILSSNNVNKAEKYVISDKYNNPGRNNFEIVRNFGIKGVENNIPKANAIKTLGCKNSLICKTSDVL